MKIVLFGYTGVYMQKISTILIDMYGVIIEESKGKFLPYTYNRAWKTYKMISRGAVVYEGREWITVLRRFFNIAWIWKSAVLYGGLSNALFDIG